MAQTTLEFNEYRGIRKLMIAKLLTDNDTGLTFDTPQAFAGVQEIGNEVDESSDTSFYDNQPAIVKNAEGSDTYTITTSVLENAIKAIVEGRKYDETNKMYLGTPLERPYVAIGFIGEKTDGTEEYVWIYKGKLTGGAENRKTKDNSTDSNNLSWTYTSIYTQKAFEKADNKPLKYCKVEAGGTITETAFFAKVWTPDDLTA